MSRLSLTNKLLIDPIQQSAKTISQPNITKVKPQSALVDPLDPNSEASPFRKSKTLTSPSARSSGAVTITFGSKVEVVNEQPLTFTA